MKPYQYALLRYQHDSAAGELVNIGVVMWLPDSRMVLYSLPTKYHRLSQFIAEFDGRAYRMTLQRLEATFGRVARELNTPLETGSFHHATSIFDTVLGAFVPADSNLFLWSEPFGGIADDPEVRLAELSHEFIEKHEMSAGRLRMDEKHIIMGVQERLNQRGLTGRIDTDYELKAAKTKHVFKFAWMNGSRQFLEPISLDYKKGSDITNKANTWTGLLLNLGKGNEDFKVTGVISEPTEADERLMAEYRNAVAILQEAPHMRAVLTMTQLEAFIPEIEKEIALSH